MAVDAGSIEFEADVDLSGLERKLEDVRQEIEDSISEINNLQSEFNQAEGDASGLEEETENVENNLGDIANMSLGDLGLGGLTDSASEADMEFGSFGGSLASVAGRLTTGAAAAASYATAVGAVGAAVAAATNETAQWAGEVAQVGQQLEVASAQSGVAASEIQETFLVAQRLDSDIDLDTIRDAFKEISLRVTEAREGTGEAREAFQRLGISMSEIEGMGTAELFDRIRQEAQDLTAQQRALTLEQVAGGEAGERLARVFNLTEEEYRSLQNAVASESLTEEQIDQFDEMSSQLTRIQQDYSSIENQLALAFGPPALQLVEAFTAGLRSVVDTTSEWIGDTRDFLAQFAGMPGVVGQLGTVMAASFGRAKDEREGLWDSGAVDAYADAVNDSSEETESLGKIIGETQSELSRIDALVGDGVIPQSEEWSRKIDAVKSSLMQATPDTAEYERLLGILNRISAKSREAFVENMDTGPDAQEVEPAGPEQLDTPSLEDLIPGSIGQNAADSIDRFSKQLAESLTSIPGVSAEVDKLAKKLSNMPQASRMAAQGLRTLNSIGSQAITQLASTIGKGLGKIIAGTQGFEDLGKSLLKQLAQLMQTIASALISIGTAMATTGILSGPGATYIAAGTALMAAGSALSAAVSDSGGQEAGGGGGGAADTVGLAQGGVTTADGMAMLHSSEIVRDKKVDDQMFANAVNSGNQQQTLTTRVRGEELQILLERTQRKDNLAGI